MARTLLVNAGQLLTFQGPRGPRSGPAMGKVGLYRGGAVLIEDGAIVAAGLHDLVSRHPDAPKAKLLDVGGRVVLPGFVDSHAHPVFAAPRLTDFELRARGKGYEEIAAAGGGILSSVDAVRKASEAQLAERLDRWAGRFIECGTTTLEAKSGYGLDLDSELKCLRAVRLAASRTALELVPTLLGAHAVPPELRHDPHGYVRRVCEEMIPAAAQGGLARFTDVFCDRGYFSVEQAELVLRAGLKHGLKPKIHAEQLCRSGGAAVAARVGAVSADHLDHASPEDLAALKAAGVVATLVPAANYFLGLGRYPSGRRLIDAGLPVALATDFNPGTAPCWSMQLVLSLACTQLGMTPEEALCAATVNGACALGLGEELGVLEPGRRADLIVLDADDYREACYYFGGNQVALVMKRGSVVHRTQEFRV
ncbi:MAG: imidazolonepropionase [Elusimicrobia bacterium]|nr:imidazolonepropionase [Elusimicrobiota bacterium]